MAPSQHIDWLTDNTNWFRALPQSSLTEPVPACPGWTVEKVVTHLAFGVGLAYPFGLRAEPGSPDSEAFEGVPWPQRMPSRRTVLNEFGQVMDDCIGTFRRTDPATPCYTYDGPGTAAFWFRRAAVETTLHRMDVAEALDLTEPQVSAERASDAVAETVEFALPLAARLSGAEPPAVSIRLAGHPETVRLGSGEVRAEIVGEAPAVLAALWGRSVDQVQVEGDSAVAWQWMSAVEQAFAGR